MSTISHLLIRQYKDHQGIEKFEWCIQEWSKKKKTIIVLEINPDQFYCESCPYSYKSDEDWEYKCDFSGRDYPCDTPALKLSKEVKTVAL